MRVLLIMSSHSSVFGGSVTDFPEIDLTVLNQILNKEGGASESEEVESTHNGRDQSQGRGSSVNSIRSYESHYNENSF